MEDSAEVMSENKSEDVETDVTDTQMSTTKLFVGNLPEKCTNETLRNLFEGFGTVVECDFIRKFGFVHFENAADEGLNDYELQGSKIKVQVSESQKRLKPGMGA